ncbi:uncharacterized protein EDB91DRAFT_1249475 [Suillus paluster]|uniref:uncharacterized protein n=1 Tax=Suillus paluster TaxID=48578 RepID=UPI001B87F947|nr:uncharacterized protein EDB91DRAFT_1249475 [Suillus paluster]KAG1738156.1 hypothetical protein EDB91DRAFT_1249475 [Suillus paluster]
MPKNVARKRATSGIARRVSRPLGSPAVSPAPGSPAVSPALASVEGTEVATLDVHSLWCLICHDGAEGDIVLYECNGFPHVMCNKCIDVPHDSLQLVACPDLLFVCLSCHAQRTLKAPVPYHGFYRGSLPAQGGQAALLGFLQVNGRFETASSVVLAATPIAVIHFIICGSNKVVMPVPLLSHYLDYYFPNGRYFYLKVPFDITMHKKIADMSWPFSDHSEEDSGWLFAGKEKGKFVAMSISQVLSTVLGPYHGILSLAIMVFLVCGSVMAHDDAFGELQEVVLNCDMAPAIIFPATCFQPLVATNILVAMVEQVVIKQLNVRMAFPSLLSLSSRLGQHTKVILMTRDDSDGIHKLLVTTFARAQPQTHPWGIQVPAQCLLCGLTNSWSVKVGGRSSNAPLDHNVPDHNAVPRHLYSYTYTECGNAQGKTRYKFFVDKPPSFIVKAAKTNTSGWFQSPSTNFPPLPSCVLCGSSVTQGKCPMSRDGEVVTKRMRV